MDATAILANMLREGRATVNEVRAINDSYRDGVLAERDRCAAIVKCARQIDDGSEYFAGKNAACEAILEEIESGQ